jgi:hypothetical protein
MEGVQLRILEIKFAVLGDDPQKLEFQRCFMVKISQIMKPYETNALPEICCLF